MSESALRKWWSWARHGPGEASEGDTKGVQEQVESQRIVLAEENQDLRRRLEASEHKDWINREAIARLNQESSKYRRQNELLQRQANEYRYKLSIDSEKIQQIEACLHRNWREYERLESESKRQRLCDARRIQDLETEAAKLQEQMYFQELRDSEKTRQLSDLLSQARGEAVTTEKAHCAALNELYGKIESLKAGPVQLNDEQIMQKMRKLSHDMDTWIRTNFGGSQEPATLEDEESGTQYPPNSLQFQVHIQGSVTQLIHERIFDPRYLGIPDQPMGCAIEDLKAGIEDTLSEKALANWLAITCDHLEKSGGKDREETITFIVNRIEKQHSRHSSTEKTTRQYQLQEILQRCCDLKAALDRQTAWYVLCCSPQWTDFSSDSMAFGGGDGESGNKVRWCLWPGLVKRPSVGPDSVLEPELVWTTD